MYRDKDIFARFHQILSFIIIVLIVFEIDAEVLTLELSTAIVEDPLLNNVVKHGRNSLNVRNFIISMHPIKATEEGTSCSGF